MRVQRGLFTTTAAHGTKSAGGVYVRRGSKGAAARVVQPEMFSRNTKMSCLAASAGWIATGSVDGSIDIWSSCGCSCEGLAQAT